MILSCPSCSTRYSVDPESLMPDGRVVRCARCSHTWTERPPGDMPASIDVAEEASSDVEVPRIEDVTVQATAPMPQSLSGGGPRTGSIAGWLYMAAVLVILVSGTVLLRETVMAVWPPSLKLYELVGLASESTYALTLLNIAPSHDVEGGAPVLVVTGTISNITEEVQAVPRLRGALLDAEDNEVFIWTFEPPTLELKAGAIREFNTRVPNPPEGVREVAITFDIDG